MTKRNVNVWEKLEPKLREVFVVNYPSYMPENPSEEDKEDYYDPSQDPLISFLVDEATKKEIKAAEAKGIEFVEYNGSFYENVDYDSIPQGTEDECDSIIKVDGEFYKVGLYFTSSSGYLLSKDAFKVSPKTIEVVVYE